MIDREANRFSARAARYARVGANVGGVAARLAGARLLGLSLDRGRNATELAAALGGLKGPIMKVAQLMATIPDALPAEYATELMKLQSEAPPMGWAFVKRRMAAELGAMSADHLVAVSDAGVEALAAAGVTAVLLPGTSFFLMKHRWAPARRLIAAGVPVALATDCNPGSSNTESMPAVLRLAVFELGMAVEEALAAATLNAACCLGLGAEIGSVEPGKRADLVVLAEPDLLHLAYHYGVDPVAAVVKAGRVVYRVSHPTR